VWWSRTRRFGKTGAAKIEEFTSRNRGTIWIELAVLICQARVIGGDAFCGLFAADSVMTNDVFECCGATARELGMQTFEEGVTSAISQTTLRLH
jgi:hypothetical protein